ncbi:MAG: hypothetical protein ACI8RN_002284 [Glaciecola sp.]|jgi:hypothetical protein|uniref:FkbM family methyltransferase n=1 Tax=Congregibacter sp. TaxID=2744308 RepID=UPI0039E28FC2
MRIPLPLSYSLTLERKAKPGLARQPRNIRLELYRSAITALRRNREKLSVVIVGANDGRTNDPFYEAYGEHNAPDLRVFLVEPQPAMLALAKDAYANAEVCIGYNGLIGEKGEATLYCIREAYWAQMQPSYAAGWPIYRAATGVASANASEVLSWIQTCFPNFPDPEQAIEAIPTTSMPLKTVLKDLNFGDQVDILQVDAEGNDDRVLRASCSPTLRPAIVFYESKSLPPDRKADSEAFLSSLGYFQIDVGGDSICFCGDRFSEQFKELGLDRGRE